MTIDGHFQTTKEVEPMRCCKGSGWPRRWTSFAERVEFGFGEFTLEVQVKLHAWGVAARGRAATRFADVASPRPFCEEPELLEMTSRTVTRSATKIVWFVAGLPLDVAAEAGLLCGGNRLSTDQCIERGAEVLAGDGNSIAGAAVIELAAIDEAMISIE